MLAHAFVVGGEESESERPLSLGSAGSVPVEMFTSFSYVALGHLHRPQKILEKVQYSGSIFPFSKSEADQQKSVNRVEISADGQVQVTRIPLLAPHAVRCWEGRLEELQKLPSQEDYLYVTLTDETPILDAMHQLRKIHPRLLQIDFACLQRELAPIPTRDLRRISPQEIMNQFFKEVLQREVTPEEQQILEDIMEGL